MRYRTTSSTGQEPEGGSHLTLDVNINNANTGPERIARDKNHPFPVAQDEYNTHQQQQQHLLIPLMALQLSGINK